MNFFRHSRRCIALLALVLQVSAGPLAAWSHNHGPSGAPGHGGHGCGSSHGSHCRAEAPAAGAHRAGHACSTAAAACPFAARRASAAPAIMGLGVPPETLAEADSGPCASCEFLAQRMAGGGWSPPVVSSPVRQAEATHAPAFAPRPPAAPFFARGPPA